MEQALVEKLLKILNALMEFVLLSRRCILKPCGKTIISFSLMLFHSNSCFVPEICLSNVSAVSKFCEICLK